MRRLHLVPLALLACLVAAPVRSAPVPKPPAENLLVNGSFEDGPAAAEGATFGTYAADATDIKGWKVTAGTVDHIAGHWKAADGKRSIDLCGNGPGAIAQTFKTTKGTKYRVTFKLAGNPEGGESTKKVKVSAADKSEEFTFDATGKTTDDMGWTEKSLEFTAAGDETTVEFKAVAGEADACGPALDNVAVVLVVK